MPMNSHLYFDLYVKNGGNSGEPNSCVHNSMESLENGDSTLHKIVRNGQLGELQKFKFTPHSLMQRNRLQQTPLAIAVLNNDKDAVSILLQAGAAMSAFVHGYNIQSLVCTLPQASQPTSSAFDYPPPFTLTEPSIMRLVDDAIASHIQIMSNQIKPVVVVTPPGPLDTASNPADTNGLTLPNQLKIGDIVRRGPDWINTTNLDGGGTGVVANTTTSKRSNITVKWKSGQYSSYTYNIDEGRFEVMPDGNYIVPDKRTCKAAADAKAKLSAAATNASLQPIGFKVGDKVKYFAKVGSTESGSSGKLNAHVGIVVDVSFKREPITASSTAAATNKSKYTNPQMTNTNAALAGLPRMIVSVYSLTSGSVSSVDSQELIFADGSSGYSSLSAMPVNMSHMLSHALNIGDDVTLRVTSSERGGCLGVPGSAAVGRVEKFKDNYVVVRSHLTNGKWNYYAHDLETTNQLGRVQGLVAGDRVILSQDFSCGNSTGWNLSKTTGSSQPIGIVVFAPQADKHERQRAVLVTVPSDAVEDELSLDWGLGESHQQPLQTTPAFLFRSEWLQRWSQHCDVSTDKSASLGPAVSARAKAAPSPLLFRLGQRVQLNVAEYFNRNQRESACKCLGEPADCRYGIVKHAGTMYNGIQRNVLVHSISDSPSPTGPQLSYYSSHLLVTAQVASVFVNNRDRDNLISCAQELMKIAGITVDVRCLCLRFGLQVWSRLWAICSSSMDISKFIDNLNQWQKSRFDWDIALEQSMTLVLSKQEYDLKNEIHQDLLKRLKSCQVNCDCSSFQIDFSSEEKDATPFASTTAPTNWTCQNCSFNGNAIGSTSCSACQVLNNGWTCENCSTTNKVGISTCRSCDLHKITSLLLKTVREAEDDVPNSNINSIPSGCRPHVGSYVGCGGNPTGVSASSGLWIGSAAAADTSVDTHQNYRGACSDSCVRCGAGTHWSCCGSTDALSSQCQSDFPVAQALANARAFCSAATLPMPCNERETVVFPAASSQENWVCEQCQQLNHSSRVKCYVCGRNCTVESSSTAQSSSVPLKWREDCHSAQMLILRSNDLLEAAAWASRSEQISADVSSGPSSVSKVSEDEVDEDGVEFDNAFSSIVEEEVNNVMDESIWELQPVARNSSSCSSFCGDQEDSSSTLQRGISVAFVSNIEYKTITAISELVSFKDKAGNTALHHATFIGLTNTAAALVKVGARSWQVNSANVPAQAIVSKVATIFPATVPAQDNSQHVRKLPFQSFSSRDLTLFTVLCPRSRGQSLVPAHLISAIMMTSVDYKCPDCLDSTVDHMINSSDVDESLSLASIAVDEKFPHAEIYKAVALLDAGFGQRAAQQQLDLYLAKQATAPELDPTVFYVIYLMWKEKSLPFKQDRMRAADALTVLRCFPLCAAMWLTQEDTLDAQVVEEGLTGRNSNRDEAGAEDDSDDEMTVPISSSDPSHQWTLAKRNHNVVSESMDKLMQLTGMTEVKARAVSVCKEVILAKKRPANIKAQVTMNFLFVGNPGTGKTTVANLLAAAMVELGFRKNPTPVLTCANDILSESDPVAAIARMVKAADGGTLFIDEAYNFQPAAAGSPANSSNNVLNYLMKVSETLRDSMTFILAGYKDEIMSLLNYNLGFPSRFPKEFTFNFLDYSEFQLQRILCTMVKERNFRLEGKSLCGVNIAKIMAQRIAKGSGKKGFGNARSVRVALEQCIIHQSERLGTLAVYDKHIDECDYAVLTRSDTIGDRPKFDESSAFKELNQMIGLSKVKIAVQGLMNLQLQNYDNEMRGDTFQQISLNRVFLGNPGTGKTTVARLYGRLLKEFGFLSDGDMIEVKPSDLKGTSVGEAAARTAAVIDSARGKVLFIDEAYGLDSSRRGCAYAGEVLDTIVEKLEGSNGSDIAVILAGYKPQMLELFKNSGNPGLNRRFNLEESLEFEDFSDDELKKVLLGLLRKESLIADMTTINVVVEKVGQRRRLDNFGNAGEVRQILDRAIVKLASRKQASQTCDPYQLVESDFISEVTSTEKAREAFADLENTEHVMAVLDELEATLTRAKSEGRSAADILDDGHMVFTGPPGTGKTTVAQRFGVMYKNLELLPTDRVEVVTAANLMSRFMGNTGKDVVEAMRRAKGGILFIDEAYGMLPKHGTYGAEAIQALLDNITLPEFRGNLIVILGGYQEHVDELFTVNAGLRSRFDKRRLEFPEWTAEMASRATVKKVEKDGLSMTSEATHMLLQLYNELASLPDWGSARDVYRTVLPALYSKRAHRLAKQAKLDAFVASSSSSSSAESQSASSSSSSVVARSHRRLTVVPLEPYSLADVNEAFALPLESRSRAAAVSAGKVQSIVSNLLSHQRHESMSTNDQSASGQKQNTKQNIRQHQRKVDETGGPGESEEPGTANWTLALEEACGALGYTLDQIAAFLQSGNFPDNLIAFVVEKFGGDRDAVLSHWQGAATVLLSKIQAGKLASGATFSKIQMDQLAKAKKLGKCPLKFDWVPCVGGFRCIGGTHFLSTDQVNFM